MVLLKTSHYIKVAFLAGLYFTCPPEQKTIVLVLVLFAYLVDRHLYALHDDLELLRPRHRSRQKKPEGVVASTTKKDDQLEDVTNK